MNRRKMGADYEGLAAAFLERQGYEILERNFYTRRGEIDLVAREGSALVFVEVKYRSDLSLGEPLEAVGPRKQERLRGAAAYYLMKKRLPEDTSCRFDVVGILGKEIRLVRDAF